MSLAPELLALLFAVGLLAGAISAAAGGASFVTFPALIWLGLPPIEANATNFVGLTPGNVAALFAFRRELRVIGWALAGPIAVASLGGLTGTVLVLWLGAGAFAGAISYLMGGATLLFAFAPYLRTQIERFSLGRVFPAMLLFVLSAYGGYFGAGLGQIMLAAMTLIGLTDFNQANGAKNAVLVAMSAISIVVFAFSGLVSWPHAIVMMVGTSVGGYFGGALSRVLPQSLLRWGVIVFGVFLTLYYFFTG